MIWSITITYVIAGDGCLMEGLSHEAISLAGHLGLNRLIVLFDDNRDLDRRIDVAVLFGRSVARFKASGWSACRIDGHDPEAIAAAIERAQRQRPSVADCLPHGHRLRRAEPAGHRKGPRRAAWRRRSRKDPRCAALAACAVRNSGTRRSINGARSARAGRLPAGAGSSGPGVPIPARARRFTMR